jgi:hypothetical protein
MGFNDNSGEIFLDATLTDLGRERIARNDGSFQITKFSFGDDEIDYRGWNESTGSANKDTTIVDTPLMEAFGNEAISLRYRLITIRNPKLQYLPSFVAKPSSISVRENNDSLGGGQDVTVYAEFTRSQLIVPPELVDVNYSIELDNDLLFVANEVPVSISSFGYARYVVPAAPGIRTATGSTQCKFTVRVQTLTSEVFDILVGANAAKPRNITTHVIVTGEQSGLTIRIPVTLTEYATS